VSRRVAAWLLALAVALGPGLAACGGSSAGPAVTANRVLAYAPVNALGATEADWPYFFHPEAALGPPGGTLDVVSLGYDPTQAGRPGGSLALGLGAAGDPAARACAVDRAGDDLAVYENAFATTDPVTGLAGTENEVATVELSADGAAWYAYPHGENPAYALVQTQRYSGFAGVTPSAQGGDRFDLGVLIAAAGLPADFRACYVRLTDGGTLWPDYGNTQTDLWDSGADIDAVQALHAVDAPGLVP
jgi:hypothetical protein